MTIERWILPAALAAAVAACGGGDEAPLVPEALPAEPPRDAALHLPPATPLPATSSTHGRPAATMVPTSPSKE